MALSQETKVGLFVFISLIILGVGILMLGNFRLQRGYTIKIIYDDIAGLQINAPVKTAGVQIGDVKQVDLVNGGKAQVTVWIRDKIKIYTNARATIASTGLIGTKYMEIYLGTTDKPVLKPGDTLVGINPINFDKVVSESLKGFTDLADAVKSFTGDKEMKESLKKIFVNLGNVTEKVDKILADKDQSIDNIVKNFEEFSFKINQVAVHIDDLTQAVSKEDLKQTLSNFKLISQKLDNTLTSLNNIAQKIDSGQGTLGKLVNDEEMANDIKGTASSLRDASDEAKKVLTRISGFKTYWDYRLNYNSADTLTRSDFGIHIRPKPDKFYYLAINNIRGDRAGQKYDAGNQRYNSITAELGHDYGPFTIHGGLIRSSGGFGVVWRPIPEFNNFELNTEVFRFDRKVNDKNKAWVNAGGVYWLTKWLNLRATYEDVLEQKGFNASLNLSIEDDDIAYFLGLSGLASAAK